MAVFRAPGAQAFEYSAPRSESQSSLSETYDYGGLEDHLKRQDAVGAMRDAKFAALYSGDVAGSVSAGNKIRELLSAVRQNAPGATERNPNQIAAPLVRVASRSTSSSNSGGGGGFKQAEQDGAGVPPQPNNPPPQRKQEKDGPPPPPLPPPLPAGAPVAPPPPKRYGSAPMVQIPDRLSEYDEEAVRGAPVVDGDGRRFRYTA
jgi:hypothetical protein